MATPTLGRERLSSRLTPALQIVPMLLWALDCYLLIWLLLHHFIVFHGAGTSGLAPTLHRLVFFIVVLFFLLLPMVAAWAGLLRKVSTDGRNLLVATGSGKPAEIPLTEILHVGEGTVSDLHTVRITFAGKTKFGHRLRFLASTRYAVPRGEPHPVVLALRETVDALKAELAATRFREPPAPAQV